VILKGPIEAIQKVIQQAEQVADTPGKTVATVTVRPDLGLTRALFAGTVRSLMACLRPFWHYISC